MVRSRASSRFLDGEGKTGFGRSRNKDTGTHILSLPLMAAELSILVPVKEIQDKEGCERLVGLFRPCRGVEALGGADGHVEKWAGRAQRDVGAVSESFSFPQTDLRRDFTGRLGWVHGGSHLGGSTRHGSDAQEKPSSWLPSPLASQSCLYFLCCQSKSSPERSRTPRRNRHGRPGRSACPPALLPELGSSESINEPGRGEGNTALAAYPSPFPLQSQGKGSVLPPPSPFSCLSPGGKVGVAGPSTQWDPTHRFFAWMGLKWLVPLLPKSL